MIKLIDDDTNSNTNSSAIDQSNRIDLFDQPPSKKLLTVNLKTEIDNNKKNTATGTALFSNIYSFFFYLVWLLRAFFRAFRYVDHVLLLVITVFGMN